MSKVVKQMMIADLQAALGDCREVLVVDVSKLNAVATNKWRLDLHKKQIRVMGVKNAVAGKALSDIGLSGIRDVLSGRSVDTIKELALKGGAIGPTSLDEKQVVGLSKSPGRKELLSMVSGCLLGPGSQLAGAVRGPGGKLAGAIKSIADKEEASAAV